jgi:hypothetical protein
MLTNVFLMAILIYQINTRRLSSVSPNQPAVLETESAMIYTAVYYVITHALLLWRVSPNVPAERII